MIKGTLIFTDLGIMFQPDGESLLSPSGSPFRCVELEAMRATAEKTGAPVPVVISTTLADAERHQHPLHTVNLTHGSIEPATPDDGEAREQAQHQKLLDSGQLPVNHPHRDYKTWRAAGAREAARRSR